MGSSTETATSREAGQLRPLRFFVFPMMSPGHMGPMLDVAKLLALRGGPAAVSVTVVTTVGNEARVVPAVSSVPNIDVVLVPVPASVARLLPGGHENLSLVPHSEWPAFFRALYPLQDAFVDLLRAQRPDCIITDSLLVKTADASLDLDIPRIVFFGHVMFVTCVNVALGVYTPPPAADHPHDHATTTATTTINYIHTYDDGDDADTVDDYDAPPVVIKGLPHHIEMARCEAPPGYWEGYQQSMSKSCYGIVVNSFYGLEPEYVDHYRKSGRRAYCVGPVTLANKLLPEEEERIILQQQGPPLKEWLDSKAKGSVVYVCFGTVSCFSAQQFREVAWGLEESGQQFLWAAASGLIDEALQDDGGFEERVKGRGMVVRGWAPQTRILNHPAVGGFLTHGGASSMQESICAGVPMAVLPGESDQFLNAKLVAQVLRIGVRAGSCHPKKKTVKATDIAKAVEALMTRSSGSRRERVRRYAAMAKAALEEGGSSHADMGRLIDDIKDYSLSRLAASRPSIMHGNP